MINVITFSAILAHNLTYKITEKFQESVDDFFVRISESHKSNITFVTTPNFSLHSSKAEKYADGTYKQGINKYDILTDSEKEELKTLNELNTTYKADIRKIRNYLLPLASSTQIVNSQKEIVSYELDSYVKFIACLPDLVQNDTTLLLKEPNKHLGTNLETIDEQDLFHIRENKKRMNQAELQQFVNTHQKPEINEIINKHYALEILVDF